MVRELLEHDQFFTLEKAPQAEVETIARVHNAEYIDAFL
jgi:hypothetical protein